MALLRDRHDVVDEQPHDDSVLADRPREQHPGDGRDPVVVRRNSFGHTMRTVIATICLLAIVGFMLLNTDDVRVDLGADTYDLPLWGAIGGAALAGAVAGWMLGWRRCRRPHTS
jgi:uncharacterized integral membrane protein